MSSVLLLLLQSAVDLSYLLAKFSFRECESFHEDLSREEIYSMDIIKLQPPLMAHPLIEVVGQKLFCMILRAPVFLCLSTSSSLARIMKLNMRL